LPILENAGKPPLTPPYIACRLFFGMSDANRNPFQGIADAI
jgi:hypothetical protein